MPVDLAQGRSGPAGVAARVITLWALAGGGVLLAVIGVNVVSVVGTQVGMPFPGDFEMTQIGIAVAAFAFLPWCQLTDANVTADIFTARLPPRAVAALKLVASVIALLFAALLLWRMAEGMGDQRQYGYTTAILSFPVWVAFVPILISLALLVVASAITAVETARHAATGRDA